MKSFEVIEGAKAWPWKLKAIYPGRNADRIVPLFHGSDFQGIVNLKSFSDQGGSADVVGIHKKRNWPQEPWQIDVLALDTVLQLFILWGHHQFGKPLLPTQCQSLHIYQSGLTAGKLTCAFKSRVKDSYATDNEAVLFGSSGELYAHMTGVQEFVIAGDS